MNDQQSTRPAGQVLAVLIAMLTMTVMQVTAANSAQASEPKITIKVGQADPQTGSARVRVNLSEGCYDGFADFPRYPCWSSSTPLQLDLPEITAHGVITNARWKGASGSFTYTPTAGARHAAAKLTAPASDKRDRFRVTLIDGRGGSLGAPVRVTVSPRNTIPQLPNYYPIVGAMDYSGVANGVIGAIDADGDPLTYVLTAPPTQGTVMVSPDGSFVYTRTPGAGASSASVRAFSDSFTVTVSDGHGGSLQIPVTVSG